MAKTEPLDPKGLIAESFRIDGITAGECRSIFLDWALSLPEDTLPGEAAGQLLARHADQPDDHPMLVVLREAEAGAQTPRRRGGWAARRRGDS